MKIEGIEEKKQTIQVELYGNGDKPVKVTLKRLAPYTMFAIDTHMPGVGKKITNVDTRTGKKSVRFEQSTVEEDLQEFIKILLYFYFALDDDKVTFNVKKLTDPKQLTKEWIDDYVEEVLCFVSTRDVKKISTCFVDLLGLNLDEVDSERESFLPENGK